MTIVKSYRPRYFTGFFEEIKEKLLLKNLRCPKCHKIVTDFNWVDYDWYPTNYNENNEVVSGEKIGSRHRHGICDNCNSWFCEEGNPR